MKKLISLFLCVVILLLCCACTVFDRTKVARDEMFALDTLISFKAYSRDNGNADAIKNAKAEITRLENLLSVSIESSDIYKINHSNGQPVKVSNETSEIIRTALRISEKTDGAFDISLYALTQLWGFGAKHYVPTDKEIEDTLKLTGYKNVSITDDNVVTVKNGVTIDLGGIAKGYIADVVNKKFTNSNVEGALLSFGGMISTSGKNADSNDGFYTIGVEYPYESDYFATFKCQNDCVVTSGAYQRYFEKDGAMYHHIIDPKTGKPSDSDISSVTVIAKNACEADAMSTAFFVMGVDGAIDYIRNNTDLNGDAFSVIIFDKNNNLYLTQDVYDRDFKLQSDFENKIKIKIID